MSEKTDYDPPMKKIKIFENEDHKIPGLIITEVVNAETDAGRIEYYAAGTQQEASGVSEKLTSNLSPPDSCVYDKQQITSYVHGEESNKTKCYNSPSEVTVLDQPSDYVEVSSAVCDVNEKPEISLPSTESCLCDKQQKANDVHAEESNETECCNSPSEMAVLDPKSENLEVSSVVCGESVSHTSEVISSNLSAFGIVSQGSTKDEDTTVSGSNVNAGDKSETHSLDNSVLEELKPELSSLILQHCSSWGSAPDDVYELLTLSKESAEFEKIETLFMSSTQSHFSVTKIDKVHNVFLLGCYLLMKAEMESRYGNVKEEYLYHGTKASNIKSICENNFDWRRHGSEIGNIFGKGVSFTPISCYASHYSDKHTSEKVMFLVKVLIANETVGDPEMVIPPFLKNGSDLRYDTAIKPNRSVVVKFCDNEFYPEYIIYYTGEYRKPEDYFFEDFDSSDSSD